MKPSCDPIKGVAGSAGGPTSGGRGRFPVRGTKSSLSVILATGLLVGSAVGAAAQDPEAGTSEPTIFSLRLVPSSQVRDTEVTTEDGVYKEMGTCFAPIVLNASDPRLDGNLTVCGNLHRFGSSEGTPTVGSGTFRLVNDVGAWQGSDAWAEWVDPGSGDLVELGGGIIVLTGEGAYDGLYAVMTLSDWSDVRGFIFEGAPPAEPIPPPAG